MARTQTKKIYWHLPIALLTMLGAVWAIPALFGSAVLPTVRLKAQGVTMILTVALSLYTLILAERMVNARRHAPLRRFYWRFFSIIFITQFLLGLFISSAWLLTGDPTLPHPFFLYFRPLTSATGTHQLFVWLLSMLLLGPAFCSHLCWLGAWDQFAARKKRKPTGTLSWPIRLFWAAAVILAGLALLRFAPLRVAVSAGFLFCLVAVGTMVITSRKRGTMVHCTHYCPLGTITTIVARLSPFRIVKASGKRVNASLCDYGIFTDRTLGTGRLPLECTLCGDCLDRGSEHDLSMRFAWFKFNAWPLFIALTTGLHAAFFMLLTP